MSTSSISSISAWREKKKCRSVFRVMKLLFSLATPIAIGIFTLVTTIQNQNLARLHRNQDKEQAEDEPRETAYINYINDVAKFYNEKDMTEHNGLYIRTKTLAVLRKLDPERKKQVFLFLQESELLDGESLSLVGSDFSGVEFNGNHGSQYQFNEVSFYQMEFRQAIFRNCYFYRARFHELDFRGVQMINCSFTDCRFDLMHFENFTLKNSYLRDSFWIESFLMDGDLTGTVFLKTNFVNVNLLGAHLLDQQLISINNSILPNGSFSSIDESNRIIDCYGKPNKFSLIQDLSSDTCAFISTTTTEKEIDISFSEHLLLIKHDQASLLLSFKVNNATRPVNVTLILMNTEGLIDVVYSRILMPQTSIDRFQQGISRTSTGAWIVFVFNETSVLIDNMAFRIQFRQKARSSNFD